MYYDKRIRYLSYYESDIKLQNAGYVKFQVRDSLCQMIIYVKGPRLMGSGDAAVYLLSKKQQEAENDRFYAGSRDSRLQKHLLGNLNICNGQGHCAVRMDAENMADSGLRYDEICGIRIELHEYQYLESQWNVVNFMPQRQEERSSEGPGYRLRRPQGGSRNAEEEKYDRDVGSGRRGSGTAEESPTAIDLIVTPVSEKLRVEKLTGGESAERVPVVELRREEAAEAVPVVELRREEAAAKTTVERNRENIMTEVSVESIPEDKRPEMLLGGDRSGGEAERVVLCEEETEEKEAASGERETAEMELSAGRISSAEEEKSMQELLEREVIREEARLEREVWSLEEDQQRTEESVTAETEGKIRPEEQALRTDKWEQLKKTYPIVHPIREEEEYLKIAPKDFVIFTEKYQELVHNSFLLHGYYNYKHLILGKREKDGKVIYYLGVPGTFHDREKTVAVMFGFEAFDGKREPAENGDFGYYLRRVEI